jgi:hypothetical protein
MSRDALKAVSVFQRRAQQRQDFPSRNSVTAVGSVVHAGQAEHLQDVQFQCPAIKGVNVKLSSPSRSLIFGISRTLQIAEWRMGIQLSASWATQSDRAR